MGIEKSKSSKYDVPFQIGISPKYAITVTHHVSINSINFSISATVTPFMFGIH